jgi:soluble lytic murein transglycosylase-like protein
LRSLEGKEPLRLKNVLNRLEQLCLLSALLTVLPTAAAESAVATTEDNVRIDVRADRRTGRLVRRVTVQPVLIAPKAVVAGALAPPQTPPSILPIAKNARINDAVEQAARQYDLDPLLVHAVIQVESAYNQYAISHAGAQGLMQLMPATARSLGVHNSFDVEENIRAGVRHLKDLKDTFKDDRLALAAYNAGAGAVGKYRWIPPYPETQEYVYKVGKKYGEARRAASVQVAAVPVPAPPAAGVKSDEPETRQVESFVDPEGRLHMRTR